MPPPAIANEIERYLRTGETDPHHAAWTGDFLERGVRAHDELRAALVCEVRRLAEGRCHQPVPNGVGPEFTRGKVEPMVRGLFPRAEQDIVLATLEGSVVYVTSENIESLLLASDFDRTAWDLANLYLGSLGAALLGKDAPSIVGLSESTTCYVSPDYFAEDDPFADFVVHEAAHIFHNCKRRTLGLRAKRGKEWLLDIAFGQRETFAYACEAFACLLARARSPAERRALAKEYAATVRLSDDRVDAAEVARLVSEAASARNGWKVILASCAPSRRPHDRDLLSER